MKKFLSIFIAVAMVLSFATMFNVAPAMAASGTRTLSLPDLTVSPGETITVPITVDDADGIAGASFDITFDSSILTATDVQLTPLTTGFTLTKNLGTPGEVTIALASSTGISDPNHTGGALVNIIFTVSSSAQPGSTSPLTFKSADLSDEGGNTIPSTTTDGSVTLNSTPVTCGKFTNANWAGSYPVHNYAFIDTYPGPTGQLVQADTTSRSVKYSEEKIAIYTMGDYIWGETGDSSENGTVGLYQLGSTTPVVTSNIAGGKFKLSTSGATQDGVYVVKDETKGCTIGYVLILYNVSIDQTSLDYCKTNTISGYVKYADGTGVKDIAVAVLFPDDNYLVYGVTNDYGQFSITIDKDANGRYEKGKYSIAIIDNYPTCAHNAPQSSFSNSSNNVDAVIYKQLATATSLNWTLDTFVDPTIVYENAAGEQSFVLKLFDDSGNPVDAVSPDYTTPMAWKVTGFTLTQPIAEISPGFYKFVGTTNAGANYIKISVTAGVGGVKVYADKTLPVTKLGVWNPQVVVDSSYRSSIYVATDVYNVSDFELSKGMGGYCFDGRTVYDKLPCTVGNSLEIYPILYKPFEDGAPATHFEIHSWDATVNGPVTMVDNATYPITNSNVVDSTTNDEGDVNGVYFVNESGKISVHFSGEVWEMADYSCETFEDGRNACCHTYDSDFNVCENQTCTVDSISQSKNADGTYDISIKISGDPNKIVDCALCDQIVAHIYTISDSTDCEPNGDLNLWYNPLAPDANPNGTGIDDLPITFGSTNVAFERDGNTLVIKGVDLSGLCDDTFVVQVFGTETLTQCANSEVVHPLIYENTGDITSDYNVTSIDAKADTDTLVAGVCQKVTISGAKFTLSDPTWTFKFGGHPDSTNYSVVDMGNGTYVVTIDPALSKAGTFEIIGTAKYGCDEEKVDIPIKVVMPEFNVQIGLKDGSVIKNDHVITEGLVENIYVTATNPVTKKEIKPSELSVSAVKCECGIPSSVVDSWHPEGCEGISPISVIGLANPNVNCDPQFNLYFTSCGADILVDTFTLVPPTISADPTDNIPFYGCATCGDGTIVTFDVKDAHKHGVPNESITISDPNSVYFGSALTGPDGTVKFNFKPTYQGNFKVTLNTANGYAVGDIKAFSNNQFGFESECVFDNWIEPLVDNTTLTLTTVYKAPPKDTKAPTITITAPKDGATVDTDTVTVSGTVTDNVGVASLYIGATKVDFAPDGSFSTTVSLAEGKNVIKVFAFDAAGNKAEKDITVTYKKPAPVKKTVVTVQIGSDVMTVNGEVEQLDVAPVIHEGHTYLPLRAIAEALGAKVDWIAATKGITLTLGKNSVGLQIGNVSAVVNGNVIAIFPPYLQPYGDGTYAATMVPLRVIAEGLGAQVGWDPATRVVTITLVQQP